MAMRSLAAAMATARCVSNATCAAAAAAVKSRASCSSSPAIYRAACTGMSPARAARRETAQRLPRVRQRQRRGMVTRAAASGDGSDADGDGAEDDSALKMRPSERFATSDQTWWSIVSPAAAAAGATVSEVPEDSAMRHIMVAVDDTDASRGAVEWAVANLSRKDDIFLLCHVVPFEQTAAYASQAGVGSIDFAGPGLMRASALRPAFSTVETDTNKLTKEIVASCRQCHVFVPVVPAGAHRESRSDAPTLARARVVSSYAQLRSTRARNARAGATRKQTIATVFAHPSHGTVSPLQL